MKVVLFGATGMVGSGVLLECLDSPRVKSVVAISRSVTGRAHPKLREIVHSNFFDPGTIARSNGQHCAMIEVAANGYPKRILDVADTDAAAMIAATRENGSQASIPVAHGASR